MKQTGQNKLKKKIYNTFALISYVFTIVGSIYLALDYYSGPSLYAEVRGYRHNHLMDWEKLNIREARNLGKSSFFDGNITRIRGVYDILLMNNGDTVAKGVRIFIPSSIGMMISRNDKKNFMEGDNATIGDLNPDEEIKLVSWVIWYTSISRYLQPEIRITYSNGTVELDPIYEVEGLFRLLDKNFFNIIFITIGLLCVVSIGLQIFVSNFQSTQSKDELNNGEDKPQS